MYVWSVYDYDSKEVKLLMAAVNNCSPVPALASLYESYGTLTDRDYEIKRIGKGQNTTYSVVPLEKMKFRNNKVKPLSESSVLKAIDRAYPSDNSEDFEEDEKRENTSKKSDDWDDENENSYESMKPQELYKLCKERDIDCKPKKSKEYYIDLLEEADSEDENDDWGSDSDDWDDEE